MKPFGYSLLIDLYGCKPGSADDLELVYRFLEELVHLLKMTPMTTPVVVHGPRNQKGEELYPEKAGVSGWVGLIESGIQIHAIEPQHFITIDVYTCGDLGPQMTDKVKGFIDECFAPKHIETNFIERGLKYGHTT